MRTIPGLNLAVAFGSRLVSFASSDHQPTDRSRGSTRRHLPGDAMETCLYDMQHGHCEALAVLNNRSRKKQAAAKRPEGFI